jgi:hypothetical protein
MNSPSSFQSNPTRLRAHSSYTTPQSSFSSIDHRGAIHKRSHNDRSQSISSLQADRLYQLAADQANHLDGLHDSNNNSSSDVRWITPQHSPELTGFTSAPPIDPYQWTAPTPPHSESGIPNVSIDVNDEPATCAPRDYSNFEQPTVSAEMRYVLLHSFELLTCSELTRSQFFRVPAPFTIWRFSIRLGS